MIEHSYSVGNSDARFDFPTGQSLYGGHWDLVADDLAEDYHSNYDGWEDSWPIELRIYADDELVKTYSVELEARPSFMAWEKSA